MIVIDAMGGDNAPHDIIKGALVAVKNQDAEITLCGPSELLENILSSLDSKWDSYPIKIHHSPDIIGMDEDPVGAFKKKQLSSLVEAVRLVKLGLATHVISAGNSGALVIASLFVLGRQQDCERPAIAGFLPTPKGPVFALDLGANTEVRPQHLYQFAHVGVEYLRQATGKKNPTVALLSNGHESGKGSATVKEAHSLLASSNLNFIGNAEPYHVFNRDMDIIVCDGFSGNVMLKTMEAVYRASIDMLVEKKYLLQDGIDHFKQQIDSRQAGGALLLGVNGNVIVSHGSADAQTIENAVKLAKYGFCLANK